MAAFWCGERMPRGLWCVTVARWIVATVVGALAVTVLLLVLTVGLSSEDNMTVKVSHGHFQVANALWLMDKFSLSHYPNDRNSINKSDRIYTLAVYRPANVVDIWVSMNFKVPGGCDVNPVSNVTASVTVFDMPNEPSFLGMVRIATLDEGKPREVCNFYHGALDRWITITDNRTLDYIANTYGGRSLFTAMLVVNTTTTTNATTPGGNATTTNDIHYCWPVTIGHTRSIRAEAITCKPGHRVNYTASAAVLGSSPPPAPVPSGGSRIRFKGGLVLLLPLPLSIFLLFSTFSSPSPSPNSIVASAVGGLERPQ